MRTKRTERHNNESAENLLLNREALVSFVQDSIADAVNHQKRNADMNGRANLFLFKVNDLVLLPTVNLTRLAVTNVGNSILLPKYIGLSCVLHCQGTAYRIEFPRRMRANPTIMLGVSASTICTRSLPRTKIAATLRTPQQIIVITN